MPTYPHSHVKVELELTPVWWLFLTRHMTASPKHAAVIAIHAAAVSAALGVFDDGAVDVVTTRSKLLLKVRVPRDVSLERVCEQAGAARDRINLIDISALGSLSPATTSGL